MSRRGGRAAGPRWIAEEPVVFVRPDGSRVNGRIVIGAPEVVSAEEARCPVALEGLEERVHWIHGASTLQALALGVRFLHALLQAEREHGLRVCFEQRGGRLVDAQLEATLGVSSGATAASGEARPPRRVSRRSEGRPRSRRSS